MPSIATYTKEIAPTKLLLIGDSGTGKTGALASLAASGYNLRVIDLDNGIPVLIEYLSDPTSEYSKKDPKAKERLHWISLSDRMKPAGGTIVPISAEGWEKTTAMLKHWKEGDIDLGPVAEWGDKDVLVIDSLSNLSTLALNYHLKLNASLGKTRTQNEARRDINSTQNMLRSLFTLLYDKSIKCNVILISHITFVSETGRRPDAEEDKEHNPVINGYPSAIGRALSPHIPRWFNNVLVTRALGSGRAVRRMLYTNTTDVSGLLVNAKSQAPLKVKPEYKIEWGLAEYFADVRK